MKYVYEQAKYNLSSGLITWESGQPVKRNNTEPNWIVYRYTDVLLMEAEAKVMKAAAMGGDDNQFNAERDQLFQEAFNLVDAVNQRAICKKRYGEMAKSLVFSDYNTSAQTMEELVLAERRRELMFEGKRWFDLVRMARRDGNTSRLTTLVLPKFDAATVSAVRIKMTDMNALYFPLNKDEIKINNLLKQNPVYVEDEFIEKATH